MSDDKVFDEPLRRALRAAADSIEPSADGLDRIWAKARARRAKRPARYGLAAAIRRANLALPSWSGARAWQAAATRWIADGFRTESGLPGRLGWLRPAAALAMALFVATGTAWAITTLPQVLTSASGNLRPYPGGPASAPSPGGSSASPGASQTGFGPGPGPFGSGTPSSSPTCSTATNLNIYSPSPNPATTPSPSPSPSPSSSTSSPSPTASPSPGATSASPSSSSTAANQSSAADRSTPTASPTATATATPGPCGG